MGKTFIIGIGPGDEELITMKAMKALKKCTVILYDKEIDNNILNYASDKAKIISCGKGYDTTYKNSKEILKAIMSLSDSGHIVGRVVKGDPYEYNEEIEKIIELRKNGVDFEVISAIPYPIGTLNYSGIPLGKSGATQDFHIIYISRKNIDDLNWECMSKEKGILIFNSKDLPLKEIIRKLKERDKNLDCECAIIINGTTAKQKKIIGKLDNIQERSKKENIGYTYIFVVGDVIGYHDQLDWFETKPFFGLNICLTRSQEQTEKLKEGLKNLGADITEINTVKIKECTENINEYLGKLRSYKHIIFTSVNGVNLFFDYLVKRKYDIRKIKGSFSVAGNGARRALEKRGIMPFIVAKDCAGEGLIREIAPYLYKGERVLIPCSGGSRQNLKEEIERMGLYVDRVPIYDAEIGLLKNKNVINNIDVILFTSPSTVLNLIEMIGINEIRKKHCIALGPQTEKCLKERNIKAIICKKQTQEGFVEEISLLYNINIKEKFDINKDNSIKQYNKTRGGEHRYRVMGINDII